ncbi:MAG: hypothetical protein HYU66_06700, partial [Armatimonadetes bacterium]|nr:hypothetical protein [Armatimonadota bacterium]
TAGRAGGNVFLDNGLCRLELDAATGAVASLTPGPPSLRGQWFEVVEEDRAGLQSWEFWRHGNETIFTGGPAEVRAGVTAGVATAHLVWRRPNGLVIQGEAELRAGERGPRLRLRVSNESGAALVDTLRFPVLRGIQLGDGADDWFTWPHTLGATFRVQGFQPGERLEHAYPDFMYMQWLDLYDREQGVYLGCLDDYGWCKDLFIGRDEAGASLMGITFPGCWVATAGDAWTTPWVQIAAHRGDWRAGADLYRPFAEHAFGPLDPPERVREMPTANCWLAHHASDGDIGKLFEIQQQGPIHAAYLMKSLNTSTPEGWDGFRGSGLELQTAFSKLRALGGSPALFTFDRAPLMGHPNYAAYIGRWTDQRRDGSYAEGFRDLMPAPFDPDLVRARVGEAVRWVRGFGIDEIHFDTAATTSPSLAGPCYRAGQKQRPNEVPHYFKLLYRAIRDACRQSNPEFLLRAEHCADFFFPEFLTSTAHFFETGNVVTKHHPPDDARMLPILFRYTLPRHAALEMPSMSNSDFWTYGYGMGYGFHGGGPSWCFNPGVREAESPPGELLHRYNFLDEEWRTYYDFRVGFEEAVVDAERSDEVAEARLDRQWRRCGFPGPLVAVTHSGGGREVTLGQWFALSHTQYFGERFVGQERPAPRPVTLRVPTRLAHPRARLFDSRGLTAIRPAISKGMVECEVPDPTCFALEVYDGPAVTLSLPHTAQPGAAAEVRITVDQPTPRQGELTLSLPAGWPAVKPIAVPAKASFTTTAQVRVPAGIFGRHYPVKVVLRSSGLTRSAAAHLRVMEPLTVLYGFETPDVGDLHGVVPGRRARLTVTLVNNAPRPVPLEVVVDGEQVNGKVEAVADAADLRELGRPEGALRKWIDGKGPVPGNTVIRTFDFDCTGVPARPVRLQVRAGGKPAFTADAWPRTRLMDLNGEWKLRLIGDGRAQVGGAERGDNLDVDAVTPAVWDGGWQTVKTPARLDPDARRDKSWGIYRRLVFIPAEWQGAEIRLRLTNTGAPWGAGGTLNLVYVNGWPCGRIGYEGECVVAPFLVFGGWNLLAVASARPNSLVEPYLFVRDAPAPERLRPAEPVERPAGAFLQMGQRCTGQGLTLPFIQGVPEGDHRRTNVAAGGEETFIYFAIADDCVREPQRPVEVAVEYLDRGTQEFGLDYDSTDAAAPINGAFKSAPACRRTDSGEWRAQVFRLTDARFANREHMGADFRLWARVEDLWVRRVEVR